MKKIIVLLMLIISVKGSGQVLQKPAVYGYEFRRLAVDTLFAVPADTFSVPASLQSFPFIARKGTSFYFWNTSTHVWAAFSAAGATPTWQQTLTAGSTLTGTNVIDIGSTFTLSRSSVDRFKLNSSLLSIFSPNGSNEFTVTNTGTQIGSGDFYFATATNLSTQDRIIGQRAASGQLGYVTIGSGLSLSSGVLSSSDITADTVLNYTQLRAYAGAAKILILTDSVRGGTFYYTGESENGATVIDGWRRVFDGKHYKPEWFEIGGKDMNGASYNRLTGTGIGSWGKAIAQICRLAGPDAIIDYKPGFQYPVDRLIPIKQNQTHKGGYLKRAAPVWTLLSNNEAIGSTSIEVADASSLQAGMLFLIKGAGTDGSHGDNSNGTTTGVEWHEILSISGNTLTISGSVYRIEKAMLAGDTLITVAPLLYRENSILDASDSDYIVKCKDMTFDGNYSQNNKIIDYQQPATIEMFGGYVIADNCTFKNIPGENIYTTGGYVTNCVANNLQGSFAHGTNNLQTIDSLYQEFVVVNLKADSVGLGTAELQGHSENILWVNSTKTANSKWIDCSVSNSGMTGRGKALWSGNADDGIVQVIRGTYKKARGIMDLSGCDSTTAKGSRVLIQDAKFNNCGWLQITGSGNETRRDNGLKDVGVYRNTFVNTRAYFDGIAGLDVIGNKFYSDSSTNIFNDTRASGTGTSSTFLGTGQQTMLYISAYTDRVNFQDNYVEGFKNDSIMTGLTIVINDSVYRKESTAMTDYYYGQDFNISGNTINNFRWLMSFSQTTFAKNVVSWKIDNNDGYILYHPDYTSDYTYGIMIPPGASGNNNTCSTPYNNNYSFPFIVYGVKSTGNYAKLIGGQLSNSRAYGKANYPINADPFNTTPYNIVLKSNTAYYGTIRWGTDANLYKLGDVDNNVFTNATLSNYQPPKKFRIGENKTNY